MVEFCAGPTPRHQHLKSKRTQYRRLTQRHIPTRIPDPDWDSHTSLFEDKQVKIDASVHTFACPLAPQRIYDRYPDARFILSFREPVARSVSHWNMVRTTREAKKFGRDWTTFEKAWSDESLHADSYYGSQ